MQLIIYFSNYNKAMVKVYYSYEFATNVGQVISKSANFVQDSSRRIFAGVNQYVSMISAKTGEVQHYFYKSGKNIPVRCVYVHADKLHAGYEDGEIVVWDISSKQELHSFDLHKSTVSSIIYCAEDNKLISGGLDGNIMIWDLLSEQCQSIKSAHPSAISQVSTMQIIYKGRPMVVILSIGKDGFLRVWNMNNLICLSALSCQVTEAYCMHVDERKSVVYVGTNKEDIVQVEFTGEHEICKIRGIFKKKSFSRTLQIIEDHSIFYIMNADKSIQSYKVLGTKQIEARKKRVMNRKKKKVGKNESEEENEMVTEQNIEAPQQTELELKFIEQKVVPFKFYNCVIFDGRVLVNNGTNIFELGTDKEITSGTGRTLQLKMDFPFLVQRTQQNVQVYNSTNFNKLFSVGVKALWSCLFSGGYLMLVEANNVQIWDLAKNEKVYELEEQWSGCWVRKNRCMLWRENQVGFFQVGYDRNKSIKMKNEGSKSFEDKVVEGSYKNSLDKYIVNLQNSQVHIQYADTHKNFLKLYGHKMLINSFDLSTDDALLATGSVDKDIRLWDMDFGHSIKTIFAHQEAVTVVKFIPETHYLLSGSKDGHVKFWDADSYQLIMDLEDNLLEIKSLVVTQAGDSIIAGGLDEGLRIWKQTNDQTIATDMEERQMEKVMIEDYAKDKLQKNEEKTRYEDLKHGEQIIEALQNSEPPKFVIGLLKKIPPSNLKSALSFLHNRHVKRLEQYLSLMIGNSYEQETCWRVLKELNRGSELGSVIRSTFQPVSKNIQVNTEILKTLLKSIKQENDFFS